MTSGNREDGSAPEHPADVVVLAAGLGSRLGAADGRPKTLTVLGPRTLLGHQIEVYRRIGLRVTVVVRPGSEPWFNSIRSASIRVVAPPHPTANMVETLLSVVDEDGRLFGAAESDSALVVAYGDIVFSETVLEPLLQSAADCAVVVDRNWKQLWSYRMDDPLVDAESITIADGVIREIGGRPARLQDVPAQYIGLLRFSPSTMVAARAYFDRRVTSDRRFREISMTEFLCNIIADTGMVVAAVPIDGGWLEVDTADDLAVYRQGLTDGTLRPLWQPT